MVGLLFLPVVSPKSEAEFRERIREHISLYLERCQNLRNYSSVVRYHAVRRPVQETERGQETYEEVKKHVYKVKHIPQARAILYSQKGKETREGGSYDDWSVHANDRYLIKKGKCLKFFPSSEVANIADGTDSLSDAIIANVRNKCDPYFRLKRYLKKVQGVFSEDFQGTYELRIGDSAQKQTVELIVHKPNGEKSFITFDKKRHFLPVSFRQKNGATLAIDYSRHGGGFWLPQKFSFTADEALPGYNYVVLREIVFEKIDVNTDLQEEDLQLPLPDGTRVVDLRHGNLEYRVGGSRMFDETMSELGVEALTLINSSSPKHAKSGKAQEKRQTSGRKQNGVRGEKASFPASPAPQENIVSWWRLLVWGGGGFGACLTVAFFAVVWKRFRDSS